MLLLAIASRQLRILITILEVSIFLENGDIIILAWRFEGEQIYVGGRQIFHNSSTLFESSGKLVGKGNSINYSQICNFIEISDGIRTPSSTNSLFLLLSSISIIFSSVFPYIILLSLALKICYYRPSTVCSCNMRMEDRGYSSEDNRDPFRL